MMTVQKTYYWSRAPGRFVNKYTGIETLRNNTTTKILSKAESPVEGDPKSKIQVVISLITENEPLLCPPPAFMGTVREWYGTLVETIKDAGKVLEKETGCVPTQIFCGRDSLEILEHTIDFRANLMTETEVKKLSTPRQIAEEPFQCGFLTKQFQVIVDPKMPNNQILVVVLDPSNPKNKLGEMNIQILDMTII